MSNDIFCKFCTSARSEAMVNSPHGHDEMNHTFTSTSLTATTTHPISTSETGENHLLNGIQDFLNLIHDKKEAEFLNDLIADSFKERWLKVATKERKQAAWRKMMASIKGKDKELIRDEHLKLSCEFICKFKFSTAKIISRLIGYSNGSFTSRFTHHPSLGKKLSQNETRHYFLATPIPSSRKYFPKAILTLTQLGLNKAFEENADLAYTEMTSTKRQILAQSKTLWHNVVIQTIVVESLLLYPEIDFIPEDMYGLANKSKQKKPDCLLILPEGYILGLEIELSLKSGYAFFKWVYALYQALLTNQTHYYVFFSDSAAILKKYAGVLQGRESMQAFDENGKRLPGKDAHFRIPREIGARVFICPLQNASDPSLEVSEFFESFYANGRQDEQGKKIAPDLKNLPPNYWEKELFIQEMVYDQ